MKKALGLVAAVGGVVVIAGCTSMTMTGHAYPAVKPLDVKILFREKPQCKAEELGFISTPMAWNQNVAMDDARVQAAKVGADYVVIETVNKNGYNDASVSAVAYKCSEVDRTQVDTSPPASVPTPLATGTGATASPPPVPSGPPSEVTSKSATQAPQNNDPVEAKLKTLKQAYEQGLITKDEYEAKRKKLLDQM